MNSGSPIRGKAGLMVTEVKDTINSLENLMASQAGVVTPIAIPITNRSGTSQDVQAAATGSVRRL